MALAQATLIEAIVPSEEGGSVVDGVEAALVLVDEKGDDEANWGM